MKKLLVIATITAGLFTLTPTTAEAGHYRSKTIGTCGGCNKNVYSYYRPTSHIFGRPIYSWVPSYHSRCSSRSRSTSRTYYRRPSYLYSGLFGFYGGGYGHFGGHYGGHYGGHGGGHYGGGHGGGGHGGGGHGGGGHH